MNERLNVLVVDDDPAILEAFLDFFESTEGYSIMTAQNGPQALEMCQNSKVDFCFTDLKMPEMDGIELVSKIQGLDNTIPVVMMTGYPSSEKAIATLKNGVVDFLVKPFRIEGVELTIQKALGKRELFIENMLLKEELKSKDRLSDINLELSEKVNDLNVLNLILQKVEWFESSSALFDRLVRLSGKICGSDENYFHILDNTVGRPALVSLSCRNGEDADPNRLLCVETFLADHMSEGMPLLMENPCDPVMAAAGIRSLVVTPLKIRKNTFGVVTAVLVDNRAKSVFNEKDLYYLNFMARRAAFVIENIALYENIYENLFATLYAFVEAIEARDPYTKQHSSRVSEIALHVGRQMECSQEELDRLSFAGHLHDIGKIGIRDSILLKPARLTSSEFETIKRHPTIGANIIGHLGLMSEEQQIIQYHHERWDGSGYPDGLKGEEIPLLSRILAVADVYDAMASDRAYRQRIGDDIIIETIIKNAGSQFDKRVVAGFLEAYRKGWVSKTYDPKMTMA